MSTDYLHATLKISIEKRPSPPKSASAAPRVLFGNRSGDSFPFSDPGSLELS